MPVTVQVPTVNDGPYDFDWLFELWKQVNDDSLEVTFDFSNCWFLKQNAVAFLGGVARLIQNRGGVARFKWDSLHGDVGRNLAKNGFRDAFGDHTVTWVGNSIPFREDIEPDKKSLIEYLKTMWLGRGWINVSQALRDAIVGRVWEIYENAFEHGQSTIGLFSCGQYYPNLHRLKLTVVDFGVGIPSNVRIFSQEPNLPAKRAMEWAFKPGTTTKPNGMNRGNGLDLLKRFVKINRGHLEVFSHEGYAVIEETRENYQVRGNYFEGTLVNISLACDESYYCLSSEVPKQPLF